MKKGDGIKKRTVVITGATRGIGRAIARRLVSEKELHTVLIYRSADPTAEELKEEFSYKADDLMIRKADISDRIAINTIFDEVYERYKSLDILINNAGITEDAAFVTLSTSILQRILHTNLVGSMTVTFEALPFLLKTASPRIINMSSLAALTGKEGQSAYALTKGGLIGFTKWLVRRYGAAGLVVNTIAPGFIGTDMVKDLSPKSYSHILQGTPLKRIGEPDEVAEVVAFLASTKSNYLNSNTIRIDGGYHR